LTNFAPSRNLYSCLQSDSQRRICVEIDLAHAGLRAPHIIFPLI
jgi:hypothetical protein